MFLAVPAICRIGMSSMMVFNNFSDSRFLEILEELEIRKAAEC